MTNTLTAWEQQKETWKLLKGLNSKQIDLNIVELIRQQTPAAIVDPAVMGELLCKLGLNDEGINEFPEHLHPFCGRGLRIWQ